MPSIPADQRLPKPFVVVWATTDSGRKVTAYVKSNGDWVINCKRIRDSGAKVLRWKE